MSVFICTECGATFDGPLVEASARAFDHSGEHAAPVTKTPAPAWPQVFGFRAALERDSAVSNRNVLQIEVQ
jgi:hypothetical protein